jgi:Sec-independent protein secretion pathway component TatC
MRAFPARLRTFPARRRGTAVLAAVLTPTQDALSMLLLLGPLVTLYYASVAIAYVIDLRRARQAVAASV